MKRLIIFTIIAASMHGQSYKQKELRFSFPDGAPNQAMDILLGNNYINGAIEVTVVGTYQNANSVGIVRKVFTVGLNPDNWIWYTPVARISESSGPLNRNIFVGDIAWDKALSQYKLTIFHTSSAGNPYSVVLSQYSYGDAVIDQAQLGNIYSSANKTLPQTVNFNDAVGIGTSTPQYKLDVNGTIHSKEVKVDMSEWPDFVFKKSYMLPTLEELSNQISEQGHLPGIPGEEEIKRTGLNLGELTKLLLQKVEELSLYLIAQDKELKKQSDKLRTITKENADLKTRIFEIDNLQKQVFYLKNGCVEH